MQEITDCQKRRSRYLYYIKVGEIKQMNEQKANGNLKIKSLAIVATRKHIEQPFILLPKVKNGKPLCQNGKPVDRPVMIITCDRATIQLTITADMVQDWKIRQEVKQALNVANSPEGFWDLYANIKQEIKTQYPNTDLYRDGFAIAEIVYEVAYERGKRDGRKHLTGVEE